MRLSLFSSIAAIAVVASSLAALALASAADSDAIKNRRELMKSNGAAAKVIGAMLDGSAPFDAVKGVEAATTMAKAGHGFAAAFDAYFPDGSKTGDTKAAPEIWDNKDEFKKLAMSLETDATAAAAAAGKSKADFIAAAGKMFGNCKDCHEKYKLK